MAKKKSVANEEPQEKPVEQAASEEPKAEETANPTAKVKTVKMFLNEPAYHGGPTEADVHPAEVENMAADGWQLKN